MLHTIVSGSSDWREIFAEKTNAIYKEILFLSLINMSKCAYFYIKSFFPLNSNKIPVRKCRTHLRLNATLRLVDNNFMQFKCLQRHQAWQQHARNVRNKAMRKLRSCKYDKCVKSTKPLCCSGWRWNIAAFSCG